MGIAIALTYGALAHAAPTYNADASTTDISSLLDGPGLSVSNLTIARGVAQQSGVFSNGADVWGVKSGVFLNTGNLGSIQAPNNGAAYSHNTKVQYLDADLGKISAKAKYDPAIIEFDITPQGDRLNFVFAFGSEEYPEYVCSSFNDAFGLFVSGPGLSGTQNAAFLPNTSDAIAVNNVNAGSPGASANGAACNLNNVAYFVDNGNGGGGPATQLDGYTRPITASLGGLLPGQTYHVKLALADAGDPAYDSGAFFKWLTSTQSTPVDLSLQAGVNTSTPAWNSEVELSYTLKNATAVATSLVQVGLEWPVGLTWVSDDSGGRYNAGTGVWEADTIPAGGSKTLKIRARVGTASSYRVDGEITFAFNEDPDSTPFNRTSKPSEDDTAGVLLYPVDKPANQPPVITSNGGNATATLSTSEGQTAVTTVTATDAEGSAISYGLSGTDAARFALEPLTGALSFSAPPDYEWPTDADKNNQYDVVVTASDGTLTDTQTLTVQVLNGVENTAPQITSNGGGTSAALNLDENITAVTKVTATDPEGDYITFDIAGGVDADLFKITASTGRLSFIKAPDYEKPQDANRDNSYEVEVRSSDSELSDTQMLRVQILNVQEGKPPVITSNGGKATATISVPENQQAVTTVTATDADKDAVTYRLSTGADDGLFQINTNSGKLAFIKMPDYEAPKDANQDNIYILTVIATDGVFETTQLLFITVTDAAENAAPKIISDGGGISATLSMEENQKVATVVTATDADNDSIAYSISGGADAALFQISSGGTLSFALAPDYEKPQDSNTDNIYVVTVTASDGTQQVTQTLNLVITDAFENLPPLMTSHAGAATATVKVEESKTLVMVATATDPNGEALTYSISGGADAALFKINAATGLLEFITAPDYELPKDADKNNQYAVVISVTDVGGLSATQSVTVQVTDMDDVPFVNVSLRVWLQGAYKSADKMMRGDLQRLGLMPALQPYGELSTAFGYATSSGMVSPFDYKGTETASAAVLAATGGDAPVDWVLVELRNVFDPGKRVAVAAGLLQRDGDIVDATTGAKELPIFNAADGLYYVMVRHRNHLAVMTETPITVKRVTPAVVDFTAPATKVYGGATTRLENGGMALMWAGDANNSNSIIANGPGSDNSVLLGAILVAPENTNVNAAFRLPGYYSTDFNLDGATLYTGPNNDINLMLGNILMHPGNASTSGNYIIRGEAPI
ncbi:MAG: hypothetical protein BWK73_14855 [Thiothrix lacustris]|uniref:Cadherin domain-containing protein n=1 Tax=Thiothrix lacustris TaxID=525917 RepID=A0A1Y1QSH8_9GAMM|nr:MAG: hypothetical protein BWK73_14855 [Thiothrix lacustris]